MHFWIDKRHVQGPTAARSCRQPRPKRYPAAMPTPVHRYPAVPTAERESARRLAEQRPGAGPARAAAEPEEAEVLLEEPATAEPDDADCAPCCCLLVVTVLGVFMLTLTMMYMEHILQQTPSSSEMTGIGFLVAFLFVCMLFFARMLLLLMRRADNGAAAQADGAGRAPPEPSWEGDDGEPPPYHEAVRLPAPPLESPPPAYDKLSRHDRP